VRVRRPDTLASPAVAGLLQRAVKAVDYPGTTPLEVASFLRHNIGRSDYGVFVGFAGDLPQTIVVALLPDGPFMVAPQIALVYNQGSKALIRMVGGRLRQWILENGFSEALGINLAHSEAGFSRVFAHFGEPSRFGVMVKFRLGAL
jgi:hypothetical protein